MNGRPSIYHGGPISGLTADKAAERRVRFARALHPEIEVISPMRWKKFLADKGVLDHRKVLDAHPITRDAGVVARDMFDVRRSTLLLADFEFPARLENVFVDTNRGTSGQWANYQPANVELASGGTFAEVGAAHVLNKPIVSILKPGGVHDHPFIRGMSGWIVASLDEAVDVVKAILLPDLHWPYENAPGELDPTPETGNYEAFKQTQALRG